MNSNTLLYLMGGVGILLVATVIAFLIITKKGQNSEIRRIQKLREGTKEKKFSTEILYQKLFAYL